MDSASSRIRAIGRTHVGRKRSRNEDAFLLYCVDSRLAGPTDCVLASDNARGVLLAVADGIGGAAAGEVASAIVIESLRARLGEALGEYMPYAALERAIDDANAAVLAEAYQLGRYGMGATVTAALVRGAVAYIAEVGDSRAYLFRRGELAQLTRDQSRAQYFADHGVDPATMGVKRNAILQAIGSCEKVTTIISLDFAPTLSGRMDECLEGFWRCRVGVIGTKS